MNIIITPPLYENKQLQSAKNQRLSNITVIRPVLVVLLVFYHAFAIYGGAWNPIEGFPEIRAYWWLDWLSYACMLETFVFVSGYVFGYQVRTKGEIKLKANNLFLGKLKRLILPCALFSLLYILIYGDIQQPLTQTLYALINGYAHMWFLPMLFWCFGLIWVIEKLKIKPVVVLPILFMLSLIAVDGLPLQFSHTMYYMPYFYVGYALQRYDVNLKGFYTKTNVFLSILLFAVLFVALTFLKESRETLFVSQDIVVQAIKFMVGKLCMIGYATAGIIMLMILVGYKERNSGLDVPRWLVEVGNLCFGVYLFQQFILQAIYYYTDLPTVVGPYATPWVGFVIALFGSLFLAWICRLSKIGRSIL